jgi:hypothetical protein
MRTSRILVLAGCGLVALVVLYFALEAVRTVEVVDKGELLPYVEGYTIWKIRILDRFELFVEPDYRFTRDAFNTYVLVGVAFISLTFAVLLKTLGNTARSRTVLFFSLMFLGANYLAADEFLGLHETLGHNMQFLSRWIPISERPDDIIFLLYLVPTVAFLAFFRKTLLVSRTATAAFVAAVFFFGLGAAADTLRLSIEEVCEMITAVFIICAVFCLGLHYLRVELLPRPGGEAG